jgi:NAD(P)-dependent dehydrogenase (short-subunit alcohol dehydrogenase family)
MRDRIARGFLPPRGAPRMPSGLHDRKVVVVTGASAGVGRATARAFAGAGAAVGLLARGEEGLAGALEDVEAEGVRGLAIPTDVADAAQVQRAADLIEEELGPIDVWVNDAMVSVFAPLRAISPDEYRRATDVTYLGTVHGTMSALQRMWPRDAGTIVQVGSALAYRGIPLQSAYCGAKHAIKGFTESVRAELRHEGSHVHLTMVQLPALNTPQFGWSRSRMPRKAQPVPPIYEPEVAADAVVWAATHRRRELYVGGSTVGAIIAQKLFPWLLDRYLARVGFESQQTEEPEDPDRPDNLWTPVRIDAGAHGRFGRRSHERSMQLWVTKHRGALAVACVAGAMGAIGRPRRR